MILKRTTNDGGYWEQTTISNLESCANAILVNPVNDSIMYIGGEVTDSTYYRSGILFKTTDKGTTWKRLATSLFSPTWEGVHVLKCDKLNPNVVFAGTSGRVHLSTDAGSSWSTVLNSAGVTEILVVKNMVYVATSTAGIKLSTDAGKTWKDFHENMGTLNVQCLEYDSTNGVLYAGTADRGAFRRYISPASGAQPPPASWGFKSNTGKNATIAVNAAANPSLGTRSLQAGDAIGVFFKRNDSLICAGYAIWREQNEAITVWGDDDQTKTKDGFAEGEVMNFKVWDGRDGKAYDAAAQYTQGSGMYSSNGIFVLRSLVGITTTNITGEQNVIPSDIRLYQNFPNPFNPTTTVRYQLPLNGHVKISVFDILGREVAVLVDGFVTAGSHTTRWDARDVAGTHVPSGVYLCTMKVGAFLESRWMILIR